MIIQPKTKSLTNNLKNNNKIKNFEWKLQPTWVRRLLQAISYSKTKRVLLFFFFFLLSLYKEVSLRCVIFSVWLERNWEWDGMRERGMRINRTMWAEWRPTVWCCFLFSEFQIETCVLTNLWNVNIAPGGYKDL